MVKCKECGGNITFSESSIRGLGFKLVVNCVNCEPRYILSCPLINTAYEVNRRITFAMRLLGIGYDGIKKFCGLMDLPKIFHKNVYYEVMMRGQFQDDSQAQISYARLKGLYRLPC
ncbi:Uncharacterized protein DBV15_12879 [Temnothorax longispinosus]|uniref:Mutator-like transposase domain-containing protein n=1 Tax=Temnothorax longispinosus TaxID=300112 RepID=A0A4S2KHK0_9HYME|nr:Uncharacterized protein DBV15_12879 [Temnothorax longispinosus]